MGQKSTILAVGLIIFAIILTIIFIVSRIISGGGESEEDKTKDVESKNEVQRIEETPAIEESLVPISKIISTPSVYEGYNVSVNSTVSTWATNDSFYFASESQGVFGSSSKGVLLVVSQKPFDLPQDPTDDKLGVGEIAKLNASGKIVILNNEQLETLLGISLEDPKQQLGDQKLHKWELGPVLLLDSYQIVNE